MTIYVKSRQNRIHFKFSPFDNLSQYIKQYVLRYSLKTLITMTNNVMIHSYQLLKFEKIFTSKLESQPLIKCKIPMSVNVTIECLAHT